MKKILFLFILLSCLSLFGKEVPKLLGPVVDEAGLLSNNDKNHISNSLSQYYATTKNQIQLYIAKSLEGENIEEFSIKVTDTWKLGGEKDDKGILFLIAIEDRKMRIEVGQGLEGTLTDAMAGRIIDSMVPYFKNGDFSNGIILGLNSISLQIGGDLHLSPTKQLTHRKTHKKRKSSLGMLIFFIFFFMLLGRGRRGGLGLLLLGSTLGGSSRSSGGGGSWSGGGGGFSGGGASGSW